MQRRGEFSFQGSLARGWPLPPRPPPATAAPRFAEDEEVRWLQASGQASPDYSSGTPSPQMWAYHAADSHHQLRPYPASAGSSPSRAQAIAGYRREMLDLVRGLPESAYELSLRDIVEHHPAAASSSSSPPPLPPPPPPLPSSAAAHEAAKNADKDAAAAAEEVEQVQEGKKQSGSGKKQGRKPRGVMRKQRSRSLERSVSLDTGLLIKLFLPLSMGGKKKVSPRPDAAAKDGKKKKKQGKKKEKQPEAAPAAKEEEWWSKSEFSEAGGSSSRTSSTGSSSNSSEKSGHVNGTVNPRAPARSWSRKRTGCYAFFRANKSKNGVGQD
ncbi:unnamed protein product [Urochloa humidicola]